MLSDIKFQVNIDLKNWSTIWSEENTFWGRIVWHFRKHSYFLKLELRTNKQNTHSKPREKKKKLRYNDTFYKIKLSFNKACLTKHHWAGRSVDSSLTTSRINPHGHENLLPCLQFQRKGNSLMWETFLMPLNLPTWLIPALSLYFVSIRLL